MHHILNSETHLVQRFQIKKSAPAVIRRLFDHEKIMYLNEPEPTATIDENICEKKKRKKKR